MKTIVSLFFAAFCMLTNGAVASADSVKSFLVMFGTKPKLTNQDIPMLADYELVIFDRFRFHEVNKNTWQAIKSTSPTTKIFLYQLGPLVANNHDSYSTYYLNNLGRFDVNRSSSDGSLNQDHPDWFLKNSLGNRVNISSYPDYYYLDFGNKQFVDYWIKHTLEDISFQKWRADGIYMDVSNVCRDVPQKNTIHTPVKYRSCESWNKNMNDFLAQVSPALQTQKQLFAANRGHSRFATGAEAWRDLDKTKSPPDLLLEEGAFAMHWGGGDVQFLRLEEWKRQIDLPASIKHSAIGMMSHTDLALNERGTAMSGEPVTYNQILRFAAGSYLLARNLKGPSTYFMFTGNRKKDNYNKLIAKEMYSKFEIGVPMEKYEKIPGKEIYFRRYSGGYVYVNPTRKKIKNIHLAANFLPRGDNDNVRKAGDIWYLDLRPHDAAIVRSARKIVLPTSPSFELQ